jgi:hypothetical protein
MEGSEMLARTIATTAGLVLALTAGAQAVPETWVDDFEGGSNPSGWAFILGGDILVPTGGNPGWWLSQPTYDTFAPILGCAEGVATPFAGDYRAIQVSSISVDARTDHVDFGDGTDFAFTLLLRDTKGTPDVDDDDFAYFVGPNVPIVGQGWVHYEFAIPSMSNDAVPAGWSGGWPGDPESFRPGVEWSDVITSVDRVEFWWIHPAFFAIFQQWAVGADNVGITYEAGSTPIEATTWSAVKDRFAR